MACGCRNGNRAGAVMSSGATVVGYEVTYPDETKAPALFLTSIEAKKEVRRYGGGTVRTVTS